MDDAEKSNKRDSFKTFPFTGINKTRFSKFLLNDMRIIIFPLLHDVQLLLLLQLVDSS